MAISIRPRVVQLAMVALVVLAIVAVVSSAEARPQGQLEAGAVPSKLQARVAAAASTAVQWQVKKAARAASPLSTYYHSTRQLYDAIKGIAAKCSHLSITWERAPSVDDGKKSLMAVRLNFDAEQYPNKPERALLFFGEHARELISAEVGLEFIRRACDPTLLDTTPTEVDATLRTILQTTEFLIYPLANPSGRRNVEVGQYCTRVNDRKVDLNRNWGERWSSESDHPDTYPGTAAWSEPETVILAQGASTFAPTIFISIHSGSLHMLSPFAFKSSLAGEPGASTTAVDPTGVPITSVARDSLSGTGLKPVLAVLKHVNHDFCRCRVGAAGKELGYLSPGTCLDFIYTRVGTRYAFALEIYSGTKYAGPKRATRRPKAMVTVTADSDSLVEVAAEDALEGFSHADEELLATTDADADAESEGDDDGSDHQMMEVSSATLSLAASLARLPSFPLPASKSLMEVSSDATNDGDVPESTRVLFPRTSRAGPRKCLTQFNPVTRVMYQKTVDHWSRGLLAFVQTIHATRPAAVAAAND